MPRIFKSNYVLTCMAVFFGLTVGCNLASADPDHWVITGVASNDRLNVRSAPASGAHTVGRLRNGTVVRNFGCKRNDSSRWCRISGEGVTGWVNGRFLMEAGDAGFDEPQSAGMRDIKCKKSPKDCLRKAERVCGGEYRVVYSESHAGRIWMTAFPGPVTWYFLEYQCGDRGGYANCHSEDLKHKRTSSTTSRMTTIIRPIPPIPLDYRTCNATVRAKRRRSSVSAHKTSPRYRSRMSAAAMSSMVNFPPTGNNVSTFQCKFNVLRQFTRVSRN